MEQAAVELETHGYVLPTEEVKHHDIIKESTEVVVEAHETMYDRTVDKGSIMPLFLRSVPGGAQKGLLYVYDLERKDFYIYLMAHMAKAFLQERLCYPESGGHLCVSGKIQLGK